MKVGLLFGSFNPVHVGHLIIANYFREFTDIDRVWFVVSPQSPFKSQSELASEIDRLEMVRLAIGNNEGYRVCDAEMHLPRPSYTYRTLEFLRGQYPNEEFILIMGGDNIKDFRRWRRADWILENFRVYVYPRPGYEQVEEHHNIRVVRAPLMEISATFIREAIASGRYPWFFLHPEVARYIRDKNLYR